MPAVQLKTLQGILTSIQNYNTQLGLLRAGVKNAYSQYDKVKNPKMVTDAGGKPKSSAEVYEDADMKRADAEAYRIFQDTMAVQRTAYASTKTNRVKDSWILTHLYTGKTVTMKDIDTVYPGAAKAKGEAYQAIRNIFQLYKNGQITIDPPLQSVTSTKGGDKQAYELSFKASDTTYEKEFDELYTGDRYLSGVVPDAPDAGDETPSDEEDEEEDEGMKTADEDEDEKGAKGSGGSGGAGTPDAEADATAKAKAEAEAEAAAAKAEAEAAAKAEADAAAKAEADATAGRLAQAEGKKVSIDADVYDTPTAPDSVELTALPKEGAPEEVQVLDRNPTVTPEQAMSMSTLDTSKEEKEVDDLPIADVRKRIDALHTLYDDVIQVFKSAPHTKSRKDAKSSDKTAREHLKKMLKAVREYFRESSGLQVGVIIPASQLIASIMSKLGVSTDGMQSAPAPPVPPAPANPNASAQPSASTAEDTDPTDPDEDEKGTPDGAPAAPAPAPAPAPAEPKEGSVKPHFGKGFNVSMNYRNSGMEAYQRKGVGRHTLRSDGQANTGRVADPIPQLTQPALARYIQKIPGFKG